MLLEVYHAVKIWASSYITVYLDQNLFSSLYTIRFHMKRQENSQMKHSVVSQHNWNTLIIPLRIEFNARMIYPLGPEVIVKPSGNFNHMWAFPQVIGTTNTQRFFSITHDREQDIFIAKRFRNPTILRTDLLLAGFPQLCHAAVYLKPAHGG